ncbi:MAG TPA: DUF4826 family protein [Burkholderiaceae bacterium]|nr:DUF4826 family protein [Burkholderiaceae bacterium]
MTSSDAGEEERWCDARAVEVAACADRLAPAHGRIGERPAWFAMPYASLWAVESAQRPEWIGWWVIAGDLPTDAIAAHELPTPRDALRAFGKRWVLHGEALDRGDVPPAWAHLPDDALPKLAAQLKRRGAALQVWADDAAAWPVDESED